MSCTSISQATDQPGPRDAPAQRTRATIPAYWAMGPAGGTPNASRVLRRNDPVGDIEPSWPAEVERASGREWETQTIEKWAKATVTVVSEVGQCWRMIHDRQRQAAHCTIRAIVSGKSGLSPERRTSIHRVRPDCGGYLQP